MELRFITQRNENAITELDEIELVNCTDADGHQNGPYTVAQVHDDGAVLLIGKGHLSGYVAEIQID